jgi:hypothetical protein
MISLLLTAHIVLLSLSIVATTLMMISVLLSHAAPQLVRRVTLFITGVGIAIGGILLIHNPIGLHCLELTTYIVVFGIAYRYITFRSDQLSAAQMADIVITQ